MRGYFAVKSLCIRLDLPFEGQCFDHCVIEFARACRPGRPLPDVEGMCGGVLQIFLAAGIFPPSGVTEVPPR